MKTIQVNKSFSGLTSALKQVKNINQFYYFMGMLTMAKTTEAINNDMYNYLYNEVMTIRSTIKQ